MKILKELGVLPDPEQDIFTAPRLGNLWNLIGWTTRLPNGSYYYLRFSVVAYCQGKYPWLSAIGETADAARKAAHIKRR
jgi:hypothetical protein